MLAVLAVTALVMQLARGESTSVDVVALLSPFVLVALPLMATTAGAALFFELVPGLRTGAGNVVWFFLWMVFATSGQSPKFPLDGIGVSPVVQSMRAAMEQQGLDRSGGEFSLGLTYLEHPLKTFVWTGFTPGADFVLNRLALVGIAVVVALVPALWFGRFDPTLRPGRRAPHGENAPTPEPVVPVSVVEWEHSPDAVVRTPPLPRAPVFPGNSFGRLLWGEWRVLVQGTRAWWWGGAGFVAVMTLLAPATTVSRVMLPVAWLWPIVVWSRLGAQRHEHGVADLLGAYPTARRRVLAEWLAGFALTGLVGIVPLLKMLSILDWPGAAAWTGGALFIPSLALSLGSLSRTHRLFQAVYPPVVRRDQRSSRAGLHGRDPGRGPAGGAPAGGGRRAGLGAGGGGVPGERRGTTSARLMPDLRRRRHITRLLRLRSPCATRFLSTLPTLRSSRSPTSRAARRRHHSTFRQPHQQSALPLIG
ncbi:hypothetical protein LX15_004875 [Streptoalloteichus tenebrarius]|uniref:Transmembrane protein n=2 Tax=Streptoalloteichus tenebrarius (strain ATCC 17920 / DSM 40477 / JCM 4838 / CBS 697.72 / NBRC 16177 / NCIMB 11028 / NRRL B-12390 / A12253. 1 / ISP 5477) TaxID=1933 RepID=A0ABT1I0L7_STRSD|nr:hypothetical protein [Streptoalloteichus tenebrarius]